MSEVVFDIAIADLTKCFTASRGRRLLPVRSIASPSPSQLFPIVELPQRPPISSS